MVSNLRATNHQKKRCGAATGELVRPSNQVAVSLTAQAVKGVAALTLKPRALAPHGIVRSWGTTPQGGGSDRATLALARRPGERAYTISNYSFPVLPRVGEVICIQFCGAPTAFAPVTAGPREIG